MVKKTNRGWGDSKHGYLKVQVVGVTTLRGTIGGCSYFKGTKRTSQVLKFLEGTKREWGMHGKRITQPYRETGGNSWELLGRNPNLCTLHRVNPVCWNSTHQHYCVQIKYYYWNVWVRFFWAWAQQLQQPLCDYKEWCHQDYLVESKMHTSVSLKIALWCKQSRGDVDIIFQKWATWTSDIHLTMHIMVSDITHELTGCHDDLISLCSMLCDSFSWLHQSQCLFWYRFQRELSPA